MNVALRGGHAMAGEQRFELDISRKASLAVACLCAAIAPLGARWIAGETARVSYGVLLLAAYLAVALLARQRASLRQFSDLSFAFVVLAVVQVLNSSIPGYVGTVILHDPPNTGNPLASTISGTTIVQLVETVIAIVPAVGLALLSGRGLGSIYVRRGKLGWLMFAVAFFVVFYVFISTVALRPDSAAQRLLPTNGVLTLPRFLALTPALLVVSVSNGFEEEFLFRGLFLQKYTWFFGARVANVLQAVVFTVAHVGVTYTPSALVFLILVVFPLGLVAGYLTRAANSVLTPAIFHSALDMAIYVAFLTYVT